MHKIEITTTAPPVERCIMCGAPIPEGRQCCRMCEMKTEADTSTPIHIEKIDTDHTKDNQITALAACMVTLTAILFAYVINSI